MALFSQAVVRRVRPLLRVFSMAAVVALVAAIAVAQEPEPPADDAEKTPTTYFDLRTSKDLLSRQIADRYFNLVKLQEWTSDKGTKINAKYVSHSNDQTSVTLAVARGSGAARVMKEVTVPTIRLSKTCQSRVKQIATMQKRLDDLLAKAAEEPADPNSPDQIAATRGRPMADEAGVQPPPRRVRPRPGATIAAQPAATPQPPPAAAPGPPVPSPSADDGSEDPLGFGELPAAPAGLPPGAAVPQPPLSGDTFVPPGAIPPPAAPPAEVGAANPPGDPEAWRTDYEAFRASIQVDSTLGEPQAKFGAIKELQAALDLVQKQDADGDVGKEELAERAKTFDAVGEFTWEGTMTDIDASSEDWTQRLNLQPLPEPLELGLFLAEKNPGNWQRFRVGDRVRFVGRFVDYDPIGDLTAEIRFPDEQPAPPVRRR
jgi:hypothetical protein